MALLELRGISKRFGGLQALLRVSIDLDDGVIASLIGPNGAGKTTFFNVITGFDKANAGRWTFNDEDITGLSADLVFQQSQDLFPNAFRISMARLGNGPGKHQPV